MDKRLISELKEIFGTRLQENVSMASFTTARVGGVVPALLSINTVEELVIAANALWNLDVSFHVIGSGSNILVSDKGADSVILYNRANNLVIEAESEQPIVEADSGVILGTVARQTALKGLSGMEWAAPVPGTVGGAVYGNAGAHGSDMANSIKMAKILHKIDGIEDWPVDKLAYQYRSSVLKRDRLPVVILSATFNLMRADREKAWEKIKTYQAHRKQTQPPGASMGSMFKNPVGDYAGRLIEAAGLKGMQIGQAIISPVHANFIINQEGATAQDIWQLMKIAQETVYEQFGICLEPEIELIGEFDK